VHHTERRKAAEHLATCYPYALRLPSLSQYWSLCQKWELLFIKYEVKVNGQYYWDILLMPYYLNKCYMLLNALLTTVLSSSKILHQCVTSRGRITLGCAAIATSANTKLSVGQSACDVYATIVWLSAMWQLRRGNCLELRVLDADCHDMQVTLPKDYHDTVFYIKANSLDCPLSYWQHVVRCRCIQNSIQSNCCRAKLSTSFLLSYDPVTVQSLLGVDYTL